MSTLPTFRHIKTFLVESRSEKRKFAFEPREDTQQPGREKLFLMCKHAWRRGRVFFFLLPWQMLWARTMQKVPLLFMGPVSRADSVAGPQKNKGTEFSACSVFRGGYLELTAEVAIFISLFSDPARPKPKGASLRNWEPGKMGMWIWPQDINRRNTADGGWITPYTFSLKSSW